MKYKVVGWTSYDGDDVPDSEGRIGYAECCAIIDAIKEHGYLFSGWDHQEMFDCAPVLNDGKRRCQGKFFREYAPALFQNSFKETASKIRADKDGAKDNPRFRRPVIRYRIRQLAYV